MRGFFKDTAIAAAEEGWRDFVKKQRLKGSGALHAFVNRKIEHVDLAIESTSGRSSTPQAIVDYDTQEWKKIWHARVDEASAPWREETIGEEQYLPPPDIESLRAVARKMKKNMATGVDALPPSTISWLSDELLGKVSCFLSEVERLGVWPTQVAQLLICLIPKDSGGRRPIGLLATIVKVWEQSRKQQVRRWRQGCNREYDWMTSRKGSARAVWTQTVLEEAAKQRGLQSAAVLIDLVKAFEMILLGRTWQAAKKYNFPLSVLRLTLEASAFTRRLTFRKAVGDPVNTLSAIVAGGAFSGDVLLLALLEPLDEILRRHNALQLFVIADDIKIGGQGRPGEVGRMVADAAEGLVEALEEEWGMRVSRDSGGVQGKTVALTSHPVVAETMKGRMKKIGVRMVTQTRNLGIDFSLGKALTQKNVRKVRWDKAKRVRKRLLRLGRQAGPEVAKAGVFASVTYDCSMTGISDKALAQARAFAARLHGEIRGRSSTARLVVTATDPAERYVLEPIKEWVCGIWDGLVTLEIATDAWKHAIYTVVAAANPHMNVTGGAGAMCAAVDRIGWSSTSATSFMTRNGTIIALDVQNPRKRQGVYYVDPDIVIKWAMDDLQHAAAAQSTVSRDINDIMGGRGYGRERPSGSATVFFGETDNEQVLCGKWRRGTYTTDDGNIIPWLLPARQFLRQARRRGVGQNTLASFRAMTEGGWFTQSRLASMGIVEEPTCACGHAIGTLYHKVFKCQFMEDTKDMYCDKALLKRAATRIWDPLYSRGVPGLPRIPLPPEPEIFWTGKPQATVSGRLYTDGACRGRYPRLKRAGTGIVQINESGELLWALHVVAGDPWPSPFRAELQALVEVVNRASGDIHIRTDNALVVRGFAEGPQWCTGARREGANLWRKVWAKVLLLNAEGVEVLVTKVKGHATIEDVMERRVGPIDAVGNHLADRAAVAAAKRSEEKSPARKYDILFDHAIEYYKWILYVCANWAHDTTVDRHAWEQVRGRPFGDNEGHFVDEEASHVNHDLWATARKVLNGPRGSATSTFKLQTELKCSTCGMKWDHDEYEEAARGRCHGAPAARAEAFLTRNPARIINRRMISEASLRAAGAWHMRSRTVPAWCTREEGEEIEADHEDVRDLAGGALRATATRIEDEAMGHKLMATGPLLWCVRCVAFAHRRHGAALRVQCKGRSDAASRRTRRERLLMGKHPVTGEDLQ